MKIIEINQLPKRTQRDRLYSDSDVKHEDFSPHIKAEPNIKFASTKRVPISNIFPS